MDEEIIIMGKKIQCKCGKLLGVRDVITVILPVREDPTKNVTLRCPKCDEVIEKDYNMGD